MAVKSVFDMMVVLIITPKILLAAMQFHNQLFSDDEPSNCKKNTFFGLLNLIFLAWR